ncbi:MAG: antibiotic biosynthesis monooxygenase [Vicinamibacteria bacterium]
MAETGSSKQSVFRIDKFAVPAAARARFLEVVSQTHRVLGAVEGCLQNLVLERVSGAGRFNLVTVVEWDSAEALENARQAVAKRHHEMGVNPRELIAELGIEADFGNYTKVDA